MADNLILIIFLAAYLLFVLFHKYKHIVALTACLGLVGLGLVSMEETLRFIHWNIVGIFAGTLIVADIFMRSGAPEYIAGTLISKVKDSVLSILLLCLITSVLSIALENVATVLIMAPIAFALAQRLEMNPVKLLIAVAVSSNLQGAATLIGDPPSMLLAAYAGISFNDFFFYMGKPSIFFAIQFGALGAAGVLYLIFRKHDKDIELGLHEKVSSWMPTIFLIALIAGLVAASIVDPDFKFVAGWVCVAFAVVALTWYSVKTNDSSKVMASFDWQSTVFLMGIFVLVGSLVKAGWMDELSIFINSVLGDSVVLTFIALIIFSVIVSAFVDNVPYLAAMLPVAGDLSVSLGVSPMLFMFALLIGACLGGNITPIGASANIVACGQLRQKGYHVSFADFAKVGLPFTVAAVFFSSVFVWFIWK